MLKCKSPSLATKQKRFQCSFETVHRLRITNVTRETVPSCWSGNDQCPLSEFCFGSLYHGMNVSAGMNELLHSAD